MPRSFRDLERRGHIVDVDQQLADLERLDAEALAAGLPCHLFDAH
jgi:hypothetical protein